MKRTLLFTALVLAALPSLAAIQYEYTQKIMSDDSPEPGDLTAKATIDGQRSRVEFLSGNLYPPGTYVISTDGARLFFIDPTKKWYTEFNAAGALSAIGANNIRIENLRSDVKQLPDKAIIAGLDAVHYQLTLDYDVTVVKRAIPLKQSVHTVIDTWTTARFGDVTPNALSGGMRTGNKEVDRLLELEATRGFPLKQTVTIRTTLQSTAAGSQLKVKPSRTIMREMRVNSVTEMQASPAAFIIPAGYARADTRELPSTAMSTLNFEPASK